MINPQCRGHTCCYTHEKAVTVTSWSVWSYHIKHFASYFVWFWQTFSTYKNNIYIRHLQTMCYKKFGFQKDKVGNEDNHVRVGKMAVMGWKCSWDGRKRKCLDWLRVTFVMGFNVSSGGPSWSNSLKILQETAVEIIFLEYTRTSRLVMYHITNSHFSKCVNPPLYKSCPEKLVQNSYFLRSVRIL
jgi:hypothetical protein